MSTDNPEAVREEAEALLRRILGAAGVYMNHAQFTRAVAVLEAAAQQEHARLEGKLRLWVTIFDQSARSLRVRAEAMDEAARSAEEEIAALVASHPPQTPEAK